MLNRHNISNTHNSDFRSRFQNDSNMQMRLAKENFMLSLEQGSESMEADPLNLIRPIKEFQIHWAQSHDSEIILPCGSAMAV